MENASFQCGCTLTAGQFGVLVTVVRTALAGQLLADPGRPELRDHDLRCHVLPLQLAYGGQREAGLLLHDVARAIGEQDLVPLCSGCVSHGQAIGLIGPLAGAPAGYGASQLTITSEARR